MTTQFITNDKGGKTAVIIPFNEYEELVHQHHLTLELTDEYKAMIDAMLLQEEEGHTTYVTLDEIKKRFSGK